MTEERRGAKVSQAAGDLMLAQRLLAGEERAFESFFGAYFPGLFRFVLIRVGYDEEAAEEIVQATLCQAVRKLHTYKGEAPLFTWLCTFCRHELSAYLKSRSRAPQSVGSVEDLAEVQAALDSLAGDDSPEGAARREELRDLIRLALERLPPRYGDVLEWKYIDGLSVLQIAERMKVSAKAVESLLTRARDAFRDGFAAVCGGRADLEP
ncbi:MAG: sigma-70 family RNA polymerase sigma factor [Planctomycetota bacterium]|nr:sigma-70 family RNA polymerase sigma factor [Planctomycetota bacterium]